MEFYAVDNLLENENDGLNEVGNMDESESENEIEQPGGELFELLYLY